MKKNYFLLILLFILLFPLKTFGAADKYPAGSLLALNTKASAVYYIGEDGKKYVFPDDKTYFTWYKDFSKVIKVGINALDQYPDGGVMPYKPGAKLITHMNTANVYAVEPDGVLRKIPSEEVAKKIFGNNWASTVQSAIPGYFAAAYTIGEDLLTTLPTGTLVKKEGSDDIYYVYRNKLRKFISTAVLHDNNFDETDAVIIPKLDGYQMGPSIVGEDDTLAYFLKDKKSRYSSYVLQYKVTKGGVGYSSALSGYYQMTINFLNTDSRPLEIRKIVVLGDPPMRLDYLNKQYPFDYFAPSDHGYRDYSQPIRISDIHIPLFISGKATPYELGGSGMQVDLKYWVIWDLIEDKQVINFVCSSLD